MRAAIVPQYGPPEVFELMDLGPPSPGPKDVVVAIHASSVNPIDWKIRKGTQQALIRYRLPWVLGLDLSGEVIKVGSQVTRFAVGDAVFGCADYKRQGTYADQVAVNQDALARKPQSISHAEAATLPLAGLTAWQCLKSAGISKGDKVFIPAGSGGVGSLAIQLARQAGAEVTTTCSTRNVELVRSLGADHVIDYTTTSFAEAVRDQDMVLDALGGDARWQALACLKPGGKHVSICSDIPQHVARLGPVLGLAAAVSRLVWFALVARLRHGVRSKVVIQRPNGQQLTELGAMVTAGAVRPVVDRVFKLDDIAAAHSYSETGRARGKIVIATV